MPDVTIDSGLLRHRVTWRTYKLGPTPSSIGEDMPIWTVQGTFWARVLPLRGAALFNAAQLKPGIWLEVTLRCAGPLRALNSGDQLIFEGRTLTVETAERIGEVAAFWKATCFEEKKNETPYPG